MVLSTRDKIHGAFKQHLLRLGVDALWEAAWEGITTAGTEAGGRLESGPRRLFLSEQREIKAGSSNSETDRVRHRACAGRRWEEPAGRGAVPGGAGAVRTVGAAVGLGGEPSRPTGTLPSDSLSVSHLSSQPAGCRGWKRRCHLAASVSLPLAGAAPRPGRNLGVGEWVRGVSVASAMLGTVTMAGKAVWHPGCRYTRLLPGLGSAWAVRAAAAASRGCGGAGEPRSPSPQRYRLGISWQGLRS